MKKGRFAFLSVIATIALMVAVSILPGVGLLSAFGVLNIVDSSSFEATIGGHKYLCYDIIDDGEPTGGVAIAWAEDPGNTPNELTIPASFTHEGNDYNIVAIAKGGFRYCDFEQISLPASIQEICEEGFAYCLNLKNFAIPYGVTEIAPSTFLDCRSLERVDFKDEDGRRTLSNANITSIGDHAFDSCVSLMDFTCPKHLRSFGASCFQRCNSLINFYFPSSEYIYKQYDGSKWNEFENKPEVITKKGAATSLLQVGDYYKVTAADSYFQFDGSDWAIGVSEPSSGTDKGTVAAENNLPAIPEVGDYYSITSGSPATTKYYKWTGSSWNESSIEYSVSANKGFLHSDDSLPASPTAGDFYQMVSMDHSITVGPYAFADCASLVYVYFEPNVVEIDDYAFAGSNASLSIRYAGKEEPSFNRSGVAQTQWRDVYTATNKTNQYPLVLDNPVVKLDDSYSCFRYSVETSNLFLDSTNLGNLDTANGQVRRSVRILNGNVEQPYAIITKFMTPLETVGGSTGGFNVSTGALVIPDTIDGYPVKVIGQSAFANNEDIKSIKFNSNLVQICNQAFYNCSSLGKNGGTLDFTSCTNLKEVSFSVFHHIDASDASCNNTITSLNLPDCLEYIGGYAFANFRGVNSLHLPNNLKAMGDGAFFYLGSEVDTPQIDLVLPNTLNDAASYNANFYHKPGANNNTGFNANKQHKTYNSHFAVGTYAFDSALAIRSVTMADPTSDQNNDDDYRCSFHTNVFIRCANIIRIVTSTNLGAIGKDTFTKITGCREIFLSAYRSGKLPDNLKDYPWGIDEDTLDSAGTLFSKDASPDLVLYVDNPSAPGKLSTYTLSSDPGSAGGAADQVGHYWNAETTDSYRNELGLGGSGYGTFRSHVITAYNVDFDDIVYWSPSTKSVVASPTTLADYNVGIVSFAKDKTTGKITAVRYFSDYVSGHVESEVDLSGFTNLTKIGEEAFACNVKDKHLGLYFILPDTITEIGERAFFRKSEDASNIGNYGVRVVTYRSGDDIIGNYVSTASPGLKNASNASSLTGYCHLPPNVERIGRNAFYCNAFGSITLSEKVTFLGNGAFVCAPTDGSRERGTNITIYDANGDETVTSNFSLNQETGENGYGIYYTGGGDGKKMLVYQSEGSTGPLTIATGTKAIGMRSCASTRYTSVTLPSGLQTIYGGGFQNSSALTSVTGVSDLRYIGAMENVMGTDDIDTGYTEIWDSSVGSHFDNIDFRDYAYAPRGQIASLYGAFKGCSALTTIDFTTMTNLRKIGWEAFSGCKALANMTGSATYTFKTYGSNHTLTDISNATNISSSVLDLRNCVNLRSINREAFKDCNAIKFAIMPCTNGNNSESNLYVSYDPDAHSGQAAIFSANKGISVLVSEKAIYSNVDVGTANNAGTHYPNGCFGGGNTVYYYAASASDLLPKANALKYWTIASDGSFVLFNGSGETATEDANYYFANL